MGIIKQAPEIGRTVKSLKSSAIQGVKRLRNPPWMRSCKVCKPARDLLQSNSAGGGRTDAQAAADIGETADLWLSGKLTAG